MTNTKKYEIHDEKRRLHSLQTIINIMQELDDTRIDGHAQYTMQIKLIKKAMEELRTDQKVMF